MGKIRAGIAVVLLMAVSACGHSTAPMSVPAGVAQGRLPIEDYLPSSRQRVELDYVSDALTRICMRRYGLDYPVGSPVPVEGAEDIYSVMYRRYGVTEMDVVRVWGYHLPRSASTDAPVTQERSPDWLRVLTGRETDGAPVTSHQGKPVQAEGCRAEFEREAGAWSPDLAVKIKSDSFKDSLADSRVRAVFEDWSKCMRTQGYELSEPLAAGKDFVEAADPSAAEIAQAVADVICKERTNLVGVWVAVEAGLQATAIERNADEMARNKAALDKRLQAVRRLRQTHQI